MKKDFTNRTTFSNKVVRECIQRWVDASSVHRCPFLDTIPCSTPEGYRNALCKQVFPQVTRGCPCDSYTLKHVLSVAKQAVKALT